MANALSGTQPAPHHPPSLGGEAVRASPGVMTLRRLANTGMWIFCVGSTVLAIIPLLMVLFYLVKNGLPVLKPSFFTQDQPPPGHVGGGLHNAITGTMLIVGLASCVGLPFGILGGIFLSEFGNNRLGFVIRFATDVLNGIPSIVIGIFVYAVAVLPVTAATNGKESFSAYAGGLALGIMMIPTIMRTTEEIVKLVPMSLREGALALGDTRAHAVFKIVLGAAKGGVVTGILLAVARISGETAPLLFTALSNTSTNYRPGRPTASLPVVVYNFATSSDNNWNSLAWGGALVLVLLIFVLSVASRYATRQHQ